MCVRHATTSELTVGLFSSAFVFHFLSSIGDEIDEDELEAELEGLEEEWVEEAARGEEAEQRPSYLAPAQNQELPSAPSGKLDSSSQRDTDLFGLPVASYST